jgi:hypothetical protein
MKRLEVLLGIALFLPLFAPAARAAEVSAFLALATPGDKWAGGGGAAFAIGFFHVLSFEAEGAYMPGELQGQKLLSLTGSAFIAPSFGKLTPFAGVGRGIAREETPLLRDNSSIHTFSLGAKLHVAPLILIKAEYRRITLPDDALLPMDNRYSLGAGISF